MTDGVVVGLVLLLGYWIVPDLLGHVAQAGALAGSALEPRACLTFDDGPGADTPQILDTLRELGVPATFFVVAEHAARHPDLIARMVAEGHEVALHGWHHRSAWWKTPWGTAREILVGRALVARLAGRPPRFYRPPWGHHNLVTWVLPGLVGMRRVLWSVAPDDWRPERPPEQLARHVRQYLAPGAIVVLHDAGGDRRRTVAALPEMVAAGRALGLEWCTVGALPPERSALRRAWTWWEGRFTGSADIITVPASDGGPPVLRVGLARYRGPRLVRDGGPDILPGAAMAEIHFQNPTLGGDSQSRAAVVRLVGRLAGSMADAARLIRETPALAATEIVGGVTVLDVEALVRRLGFQRVPVGGWRMFWMRLYLIFLMGVYHVDGWRVWRRLPKLSPVLIYMPTGEFLARYGEGAGRRPRRQAGPARPDPR
jgi:peptidoglycan/xylan/chitin deacetylase (PgdA/CDA1 family)